MPTSILPAVLVRHVQSVASDTWLIEHGQHGYPLVDAFSEVEGVVQKLMPNAIEYVDDKTVRVKFSQPRTGFATVII